MSEAAATSCPKCGAAIPPEAPQGLCPKCLLQQASFPTETGPTTRHTRPAPPDRDELARAFPHLQILELIGQGGMGFVYKARQPKLDRLVALKILAQPLAEQTHFAERFTREGRTLAKLNHPNIVTIHDFGQAGPFFYLLMEYVDGVNLRQAMRAGAINSSQALAIVPRICEALQYAHNEGVLHRDIKPDNILLDTRGRVKIADFGIAKLLAEAVAENPLTGSGASLGTPHYMAPEQIEKPNAVDHRADIYSLGVVFYEMLTGELPLGRFAAPSEKSAIDPRLDEVVFQTLEKQPERRPQSADEVKTRVETISSGSQRAESSEGQVTFKMSKCYLTTPQFLSSRVGRLLRYTNKGELRLDEETLTFVPRHQNWIVIPLRAITSLSMGEFPAGIGKIKFISVTFTEKGNTHRFFFIPTRGAFRSIWNTNQLVEEWFNAIRHAAKARTGRVPPSFKDDLDPLPSAPTSKASLSSGVLKAAFTLALVVILGLGVGFGAFIGFYALLRKPGPRESDIPAAVASPDHEPAGPTKTLHLAFDYFGPSPEHNINLKGVVDLANDEFITTAIRYNDADWSFVRFTSTWDTEEKLARLHWPIPENFSIPFDLEPGVAAFFHHAPAIPIRLSTNGPLSLFTVTNALHQRITLGIAYSIAPTTNSTAKLSNLAFRATGGGFDIPCAASLPSGMGLQAWFTYAGGYPTTVRVTRDMPGFGTTIAWKYPSDFRINNLETLQRLGRFKSPPFAEGFAAGLVNLSTNPLEVFAIANSNDESKVWRGFIKMIPVDLERASNTIAQNPNPSTVSNPPNITNSPAKTADSESLNITLFRHTIDPSAFTSLGPRTLAIDALADLNLDEDVFAVVRPLGANQTTTYTVQPSDFLDTWLYTGPGRTNRIAKFSWVFPESFGMQVDILPQFFAFWGSDPIKTVHVQLDHPTRLFTVTNALGQVIGCDLEFRKKPAFIKDPASGIIVTEASALQQTNGIKVDLSLYLPRGAQVTPFAIADNKRIPATFWRYIENAHPDRGDRPQIFCTWEYPGDFSPPALQPDPSRTPMGNGLISFNPTLHPPFMDNLARTIRAGDARITTSAPLEIFALTNAEGKIFRGVIEINREHERSAAQNSPGSATPAKKTFEFTSVTNSDDYVVLQSETPLEVGKSLIATIEDSIGKNTRTPSGLTVLHTPNETHISTRLMWKMPDGSPTNWMATTLQKIHDTILAKPIQFSEGETVKLFDLRSTPGFVEQFAAVRYESVPPSKTQTSATVRVRSAYPLNSGLILQFDADVPPGYRLEAESDPNQNGSEARLDCSNVGGHNHYSAIWTFENMRGQNLADMRFALTNRASGLTHDTFAIDAGKPKTIFTFKTTSGDEFPVILKLNTPYER